jgi:hypothetical protein
MTRSPGVLATAGRYARWGLPWICALVVSASLAYAMNNTVAGGSAGRESQVSIATEPASTHPMVLARPDTSAMAPAQLEGSETGAGCDISGGRLLYAGLNTWVPAEPKVAPCPIGGS